MLLFCQLLINRDKVHQPNSESPAGAQSENRDCSKETGDASGMCFVNLVKSIKYLKHYINSRTLTRHNEISLRASSPFGRASERRRKGELATISHKFSFLLRLDEARYHWTARLWWQFSRFAVSRGFRGGNENSWEIVASSLFSPPPPAVSSFLACTRACTFPQVECLLAGCNEMRLETGETSSFIITWTL